MYETREERESLLAHTGKYTELKLLNEEPTGFGWAVLVQDNYENNRPKVIKLPNREATTRELLNEAEILSRISQYLRHPNLIELGSVECYRIPWDNDVQQRWFVVLQYGGNNLRSRLGRLGMQTRDGRDEYVYHNGNPLPLDEALDIAIQVTDGLRALHEFEESPGQHIVHRDIKPENILIDDQNRARLTDFGISKVVERLTQSFTVAGTPPYLAPEYSTGRLTAASDIYSLGIVLYEMLTGRFPFQRFEDRFYNKPMPLNEANPNVPAYLSDVILRMLAYDRSRPREEEGDRYQQTAELLADLKRCQSRLHPVPRQFQSVSRPDAPRIYRNTNTNKYVRISLIDTDRPLVCLGRLDAVLRLDVPHVAKVFETFHDEEMVGIVNESDFEMPAAVPTPVDNSLPETHHHFQSIDGTQTIGPGDFIPESLPGAPAPRADLEAPPEETAPIEQPPEKTYEGKEAYAFVCRIQQLCEQLNALHRLGMYHGFLTPQTVDDADKHWDIDGVWMGRLVGASKAESLFAQTGVDPADLAPEVLQWDTPPTLSCDIYGIGCLLYHGFTSAAPLDRDAATALACHGGPMPAFRVSHIQELAPNVPHRLQRIVVKALQLDPAARHQSLDELVDDLASCHWPQDMTESLIEDALDLQKQGKVVEAYDQLDEALSFEPGSPAVHHARAKIFFLEGEYEWTLKQNQIALDIEPTGAVCALHAQAYLALGQTDEACKSARMSIRLEESAATHQIFARCLEQAGRAQEALVEYEQAYEMAQLQQLADIQADTIKSELTALLSRLDDTSISESSGPGGTP